MFNSGVFSDGTSAGFVSSSVGFSSIIGAGISAFGSDFGSSFGVEGTVNFTFGKKLSKPLKLISEGFTDVISLSSD